MQDKAFKLTYSTMFDPPEELHLRFEAALAGVKGRLGAIHPMRIGGRGEARPAGIRVALPDRPRLAPRALPARHRAGRGRRRRRGARGVPAVGPHAVDGSRGHASPRRVLHRGADLRAGRGPRAGGRQEPPRIPGGSPGDRRPHRLVLRGNGGERRLRALPPRRSGEGLREPQPHGAQAPRRLGGHRAVQLPHGARGRAHRRGARGRQHRGLQGGERHGAGAARC